MEQIQWVIVDKVGCKREGAYETKAEALVALERDRLNAIRLHSESKLRIDSGHAEYTDKWDINALQRFTDHEWRVDSEKLRPQIYRLNADISSDEHFIREFVWKLRVFGSVEICWTCTGHTRAHCQGASTSSFLSSLGYSSEVNSCGDVFVKTPLCK